MINIIFMIKYHCIWNNFENFENYVYFKKNKI